EQFAYIPSALIPRLADLTNGHNFFVDGEILVTTPAQTPGKYLLVGALGRGGKGLYGLDVSNPADFQPNHVRWEFNSPQTCPDTNPTSAYLGNVISSLAYAEVGGNPSAVFGNGYNSCSDKAALGIVNIDTGSMTFIEASNETSNGLAAPAIRIDEDTAHISAYAGDLRGKMWRFDLTTLSNPPRKLLETGPTQPITARPVTTVLKLVTDVKKSFIHFGTGRYLSISDRSTTAQQNIYGLIDDGSSTLLVSNLVQRVFDATGSVAGILVKTIKPLASEADMNTWKGWYIPLVETGERIVSAPTIIQTAQGDVAIYTTIIPPAGGDPCDPKGSGWLYAVNAQTGSALDFIFLDLNGDGKIDSSDTLNGKVPSAIKVGDLLGGMPGQAKVINSQVVVCGMDTADCVAIATQAPPNVVQWGRRSWRRITR
ncbi:MAG: hypothetical protein LBV29_00875, partial [Azoarcus sp.]|nr:hypothetical protein [Azoarcus sp.]